MAALSSRARRALTLMFVAVVVLGATAIYFVRPSPTTTVTLTATAPTSRPFPVQRTGDIVFYNFVSAALGWAAEAPQPGMDQAGFFSIYKTVDAGRHWRKQLSGHSLVIFTSIFTFRFVDANHGFLVAGDPLSLNRTTDGGEHWARLELPTQDARVFQFTDPHHLWLLSRASIEPLGVFHLYASSDAGASWTRRPDVPASFFPLFRNGAEGWSGSGDQPAPRVFVTADGGLTWTPRDLPVEPDTPVATSVQVLPGTGVVVLVYPPAGGPGAQSKGYVSLDGGRSWSAIAAAGPRDQGLGKVYAFEDTTHWWSIQDGALYKTSDAGRSWMATAVEPSGLQLLQAFDSRHAWAQLDEGYGIELVSTSDGGLHWTRANVPIPQ